MPPPFPERYFEIQYTFAQKVAFETRGGVVSNLWTQPIEGDAAKQITDFKQERIFSFDYSRDGKQLALSRGTINNDVVMISKFK